MVGLAEGVAIFDLPAGRAGFKADPFGITYKKFASTISFWPFVPIIITTSSALNFVLISSVEIVSVLLFIFKETRSSEIEII